MTADPPLEPVIRVGTSLKYLREFPAPVQDHMGYACTSPNAVGSIKTRRC